MERKIRVVMAKLGLDIHWRGVYLVSQFLKDAGMDVIYLGNKFPEDIVEAAIDEDADVIGLSTLGGNHLSLGPRVVQLLKARGMEHINVFMGGVMAPKDAMLLEQKHGVVKVYLPDTPMGVIIDGIKTTVLLQESKDLGAKEPIVK